VGESFLPRQSIDRRGDLQRVLAGGDIPDERAWVGGEATPESVEVKPLAGEIGVGGH
jgi:hypothetical protein